MKREKTIIDLVRFCINRNLEITLNENRLNITLSNQKFIHFDRKTNKVMFDGEGFTTNDDIGVVIEKLKKLLPVLKRLEQVKKQLETIK